MKVTVPDYFDQFRCLAGACPHSCCEKWEVVIDEESVCLYETVSGPLGEKLRGAMETDEDGDVCFPLNGGRCPFLDQENHHWLTEYYIQSLLLSLIALFIKCREITIE